MKKSIIDKALDLVFDKDKTKILLMVALILAFVLRFWAAATTQPFADDLVYGTHAINWLSADATSNQNQSPLWFALADIFYRIFGVSLISGRLTSIIFGSLTVLITFLIANLIFDKKVAIISSFLLAISSFHIKHQVMEMDMVFAFFTLLAAYLFLEKLKKENKISLLAFLFLGLAILSKSIPITTLPGFILAFVLYYLYKKEDRKQLLNNQNKKNLLLGIIILFLLLLPLISYNYLLYKEKGLTDVMFARFFDVGMENFASIQETLPSFSFERFFEGLKTTIFSFFIKFDSIIFLLGAIGFFISFRKKYPFNVMLVSIFIFTYIFLTGTSVLSNHYVFMPPVYAIFAAIPLSWLTKKIKLKYILSIIVLLILLINIYTISDSIFSKSPTGQLRKFANSEIGDDSLVIMDSRTYIGLTSWTMNDKHYIDASLLPQIIEETNKLNTKEEQINTFFIECAPDNCGGVSVSPSLNESMEKLILQFANPIKVIYSGGGDGDSTIPYFKIYQATLSQKPQILNLVDQTHMFFFYPVRWALKDQIYDSYTPRGVIDNSIDLTAHLIMYLAILLSLLSPVFLVYKAYETFKKDNKIQTTNEDNSNNSSF
ncbi:MAG: glycosyltransferase family 39 protein [Nanoarchaeota archaeon]